MQTNTRAIRLAVQEVLERHGIDNVRLEWELDTAIQKTLEDHGERLLEKEKARDRQRIFEAMVQGTVRDADMKALWHMTFGTHPNWNTKVNKDFLTFLRARPSKQTLDDFAEWWWKHDWRGKQSEPPTPSLVMESWDLAFMKAEPLLFDV